MRKIYMRIIREREKNKEKIDMSQCALEKIIMLIITLTEKKMKEKIYC